MEKLYSINDISKMTGITKRTLHYYDEIALLKPDIILENKYRQYKQSSLSKLQEILFFKELDFPLKEIAKILNHKDYDANEALKNQKALLILKKKRLQGLINLIEEKIEGDENMDFKAFDVKEIREHQKKYSQETKEKYGQSDSYKESKKKYDTYTDEDLLKIQGQYDEIFKALALSVDEKPTSQQVQSLVKRWQDHITSYYYPCNNDMLLGLSQMYLEDETFKASMDKYGQGTTDILVKGIQVYCKK